MRYKTLVLGEIHQPHHKENVWMKLKKKYQSRFKYMGTTNKE